MANEDPLFLFNGGGEEEPEQIRGDEAPADDEAAAFGGEASGECRYHLSSTKSTVLVRQIRSQELSFQLRPAASSLVTLLDRCPSALLLPPSNSSSPIHIIELGSGTGLVGIAAASILGARVTLTDLPHVLPNLRFNADANSDAVAAGGGSVDVRQLRWGEDEDAAAFIVDGTPAFDAVLASDVVYDDQLIDPLLRTLRALVKGEVVFVMAHLKRWKNRDAVFFRKARKVFDVSLLHADPPLPGKRLGVAICRFTDKTTIKESTLVVSAVQFVYREGTDRSSRSWMKMSVGRNISSTALAILRKGHKLSTINLLQILMESGLESR